MGQWTQYDEDSTRLPEGMKRIGYDADTQQYTFQDTDGSIWVSAPGWEYGKLSRVSSLDNGRLLVDEEGGQLQEGGSVNDVIATDPSLEKDIKSSWRMLAPFLLLVCLVPVLAFKLTAMGSQAIRSSSVTRDCSLAGVYPIIAQKGDTCWDLAQGHSLSLDELNDLNEDMNCEKLSIGEVICLKNPLKT